MRGILTFFSLYFILLSVLICCQLIAEANGAGDYVSFDRFTKTEKLSESEKRAIKSEVKDELFNAKFPLKYKDIYIGHLSGDLKAPVPGSFSNLLLFNFPDDVLQSLPKDYFVSLFVNPGVYPQQRVRLLDAASRKSPNVYGSNFLGELIKEAKVKTNIDADSRIWSSRVTLEEVLFLMFDPRERFLGSFPSLSRTEHQQMVEGISYRWMGSLNFNKEAMQAWGSVARSEFWTRNQFMCDLMLSSWFPQVSQIEYIRAENLAKLLPCMTPDIIRELRRRQNRRIGHRNSVNNFKPMMEGYAASPETAPRNRMTKQELINTFIELSVFAKDEDFFRQVSGLLPYMGITVFHNNLYHTKREKGIARLVANFTKNFALIENLEYDLRRTNSMPSRRVDHTYVSALPNIWSSEEICESLRAIKQGSEAELTSVIQHISDFNDNLMLAKKMEILFCYLKLTKKNIVHISAAVQIRSLIKGAKLPELPTLRISEHPEHVEFLQNNEANLTPLQRYHFLEQEQSNKLTAGALLSLGEHYLSDFGIFRLDNPNLLTDIGFRYSQKEGLVNLNPVDHKTITGNSAFKLLILDRIGDDLRLGPEIARRHNFASSFAPSHLEKIRDSEFFDVVELLDKSSLSEEVLIELADKTKIWKQKYISTNTAQNFSLIDLEFSEIEALGGYVLKHFKVREFERLRFDHVKCNTIFGFIGESVKPTTILDFALKAKLEVLVSFYVNECIGEPKLLKDEMQMPTIWQKDLVVLGSLACFLNRNIYSVDENVLTKNLYRFADCLLTHEQGIHMHNKLSTIFENGNHELDVVELLKVLGPNICLVFTPSELEQVFFENRIENISAAIPSKWIHFFEAIATVAAIQNPLILPTRNQDVELCGKVLMENSLKVLTLGLRLSFEDFEEFRIIEEVTCSRLRHLGHGIAYISPEVFDKLSAVEVQRCLEYFTHNPHTTEQQLRVLESRLQVDEKLNSELDFSDSQSNFFKIQKLGSLYRSFIEPIKIGCNLSLDVISVLGKLDNLEMDQMSTLFECAKLEITDKNGFLSINGIKMAGNLLCGASMNGLKIMMSRDVALSTLSDLSWNLKKCSREKLNIVFDKIEDSITKWKPSMIYTAGIILAGIPVGEIGHLTRSQIEFIHPEVFTRMSSEQFTALLRIPNIFSFLGHRQLLELNRVYLGERNNDKSLLIEMSLFGHDSILIDRINSNTMRPKLKGYLSSSAEKRKEKSDLNGGAQTESSDEALVSEKVEKSQFVYVIINSSVKTQWAELLIIVVNICRLCFY